MRLFVSIPMTHSMKHSLTELQKEMVRKDFRGQGLGSRLMETVLADLRAEGFQRVTIGVGPEEEQNVRLYRRMGFSGKIKDCYMDPCAMDENMRPRADDCYWLLAKDL